MARRGINKVIVLGNLGSDPEVAYMANGNAVTKVSVATSESWKDKQSGQEQERAEWHRAVAFGKLAEIMGEYLRKGSKVYIEGQLRTNKWQDQSGNDRYTTEIIVSDMQMLDSRNDNNQGQSEPHQGQNQQSNDTRQDSQQRNAHGATVHQSPASSEFSDDIPFN